MATAVYTTQAGNKEQVAKSIANISPTDTPIFKAIGTESIEGVYSEWLTDSLSDAKENIQIEKADYGDDTIVDRARTGNYAQLMWRTFKASNSQEAAAKHGGITSEYEHQKGKAAKSLALDVEYMIVNNTASFSGIIDTSGRKSKGLPGWIATNTATGASANWSGAAGTAANGEEIFNVVLQAIWVAGGNPTVVFLSGRNKRHASRWTAGTTKFMDVESKRMITSVSVYESDFDVVKIKPHRMVSDAKVFILDVEYWKTQWYRAPKSKEIAPQGSYRKGVIEAEVCLKSGQEKSSGMITLS